MAFFSPPSGDIKISAYLDNGLVYSYFVTTPESAREHAAAIVATGYRHCVEGELTHFPPHRIIKVKAKGSGISTTYPDEVSGT